VAVLRYNCRLVLLMDLIEQQDWLTALDERMIILQDELAEMKRPLGVGTKKEKREKIQR